MATAKTTTLTFRIEPELREALRSAAEREHRSIANMVAVLIHERPPGQLVFLDLSRRQSVIGHPDETLVHAVFEVRQAMRCNVDEVRIARSLSERGDSSLGAFEKPAADGLVQLLGFFQRARQGYEVVFRVGTAIGIANDQWFGKRRFSAGAAPAYVGKKCDVVD